MDKGKFNELLEDFAIAHRELKACCTPDDHIIAYNNLVPIKKAIFDFVEPPIPEVKTIKDLTKEQAIEIAKLLYPWADWIKSDFEFHYDDGNRGAWIDDRDQCVSVSFSVEENIEPKNKIMHVHIYRTLDVTIGYFEWREHYWYELGSRGTMNQYRIQEKFREWGIQPIGLLEIN